MYHILFYFMVMRKSLFVLISLLCLTGCVTDKTTSIDTNIPVVVEQTETGEVNSIVTGENTTNDVDPLS